jgi:hypothetical protein
MHRSLLLLVDRGTESRVVAPPTPIVMVVAAYSGGTTVTVTVRVIPLTVSVAVMV